MYSQVTACYLLIRKCLLFMFILTQGWPALFWPTEVRFVFSIQTKRSKHARALAVAELYPEPSAVLKLQLLTTDVAQGCMLHLMIWPILSDIVLRYNSVCSACPVCPLEHDKIGLYLWSYLFLLLSSCSQADAAFYLRADNYKRTGISPVGVP